MAQLVKNPPAMQETWVGSLGWEDPLEEGTATHSSILAWRIPPTVYSPWGHKESDRTERFSLHFIASCIIYAILESVLLTNFSLDNGSYFLLIFMNGNFKLNPLTVNYTLFDVTSCSFPEFWVKVFCCCFFSYTGNWNQFQSFSGLFLNSVERYKGAFNTESTLILYVNIF